MASIEEIKERLRNKDQLEAELAKQYSRPSLFTTAVIFVLAGGAAYNYLSSPSKGYNASKSIAVSNVADPSLVTPAVESTAPVNTVHVTAENIQTVMPELQKIDVNPNIDRIPTDTDLEETGLLILPEGAKQGETQYRLITRLPASYRSEASQFPDFTK